MTKKIWRTKWRGDVRPLPNDPAIALAKQLQWTTGSRRGHATTSYPEPCNLTAASAWPGQIPDDMLASDCIVYKDSKTNLWVQAVAIKLIPLACVPAWIDLQLTGGAVAVWTNKNAQPPRHQQTFMEQEINPRSQLDPITYTHILNQMGKLKIGDIDLKTLYPDKFDGIENFNLADIDNIRLYSGVRLKGQKSNSKCVQTPHGVFMSAAEASRKLNLRYAFVIFKLTREEDGYRYITRQEYLKLTNINTNEEQSSL